MHSAVVHGNPSGEKSLKEWLQWQESLHFSAIDLGLDRVARVATRLLPESAPFSVISISGTNGKGSSAVMLEQLYSGAGYRTGCYTSPHLLRYNERIRINGTEVSDDMLCESFQKIDRARGDISLTYFEFGTLAALDIFHRQQVELAVLEVGLGGRLDAVNIMDADVALVCAIDIDHEKWLGADRNSIGYEKAGIFRKDRPAVCSDPQAPPSIQESADRIGARLYLAGRDFSCYQHGDQWSWESGIAGSLSDLPCFHPDNSCLIRNAAGVLMVTRLLEKRYHLPKDAMAMVINKFRMPGRFQIVPGDIEYVLDVAHNRQAAAQLASNLAALPHAGRTYMVIGMLMDKNHDLVLTALSNSADFWYVVPTGGERGMQAGDLAEKLSRYVDAAWVKTFDDLHTAFEVLDHETVAGDRVIVTGSFLTVAAAIEWLQIEF